MLMAFGFRQFFLRLFLKCRSSAGKSYYFQIIIFRKFQGISNLPELLGIYRHPVSSRKKRLNVEIFTFTLKIAAIRDLIVPGLNNRYILKKTNIESIHKVRTNRAKYSVFSIL